VVWLYETPDLLKRFPKETVDMVCYLATFFGAGLAWYFRRANMAIAFVLLACAFYSITEIRQTSLMAIGFSVLLPLNIWLLAVWEDRGVLTPSGISRMIFIFLQVLALYVMVFGEEGRYVNDALKVLHYQPEGIDLPFPSDFLFIAWCLYGFSITWFVIRSFHKSLPSDLGWLTVLIGTGLSLLGENHIRLFFTAGLCCLMLAVILESYRMAFLDELTGLPGRRALMSDLKKLGNRYVIAMADIDHFKKFNDTHGHDVGDHVLRMVATSLSKVTGGGRAYRYGGEEFTIVFANKSLEEALNHLEQVRERVEKASFTLRAKDRPKKKPKTKKAQMGKQMLRVTSSFGAAEHGKSASNPMDVMKMADQALYRAKKAGRNCVSS